MGQWIETLDRLVWGPGLLAALLLTGGMLTVRLRFLPCLIYKTDAPTDTPTKNIL